MNTSYGYYLQYSLIYWLPFAIDAADSRANLESEKSVIVCKVIVATGIFDKR